MKKRVPVSTASQLRSLQEIQQAHDVMVQVVTGEISLPVDERTEWQMEASLAALCWVLQHDHIRSFADFYNGVSKYLKARGYELRKEPNEN